jgi:hypothetical protein
VTGNTTGPPREGVLRALRSLATTYVGAQRAGDELRTRLVTIEQQRARLLGETQKREYGSSSDRELADVERVRRTLARSSAASTEHVRALEALISAVAADTVAAFRRAPVVRQRAATGGPADADRPASAGPGLVAPTRPDPGVRGGWSPPSPDPEPPARRRLQ